MPRVRDLGDETAENHAGPGVAVSEERQEPNRRSNTIEGRSKSIGQLGRLPKVADISVELGKIAISKGDVDQAEKLYLESLSINENLGDVRKIASNSRELALLASRHNGGRLMEELRQKALDRNRAIR